ncbi:Regulator of nucleoside diphosphate kinase [Rubellimicrobium mesophilum DSM 19309]|uniref:Regulator of nucleoside diphosphate kinase n=1 Tax=Rubellimicrobium mesophilum DSM 19309 TaxID=442562 RepID=A0A017HQL2_9RHOB|nr:Regulator of nucleoside diphosphate kinase [Rubellimicrobium mesophilum DSM 19309]
MASAGPEAEAANELLTELVRAEVLPEDQVPSGLVRMGSTLSFRTEAGQVRRVTLVFPQDADIAQGKVSVLTPIGAALVGLSVGQSIPWTGRDGRVHRLTVESVGEPETRPADRGSAASQPR